MDEISALIARYDRNVPRYTSYPTANHFSGAVSAAQYRQWLAELAPDAPLSLYLHVPFCKSLCRYCGCHTRVTRDYESARAYAGSLVREIELLAAHLPGRRRAAHLHWGGGTPTFLEDAEIAAIFEALRRAFDFAPGGEIAMEIDPRTLKEGRARFLAGLGLNRASLGVQDFDPQVQEAIGRIQPFETVARAVSQLREAGISAVNFDLIYGLPRQDEGSIRRTAEQAISLDPDRLAIFGYAHVPWFKPQQKILERYVLPDARARYGLAALAARVLKESGYVAVGLDHFAKESDPLVRALNDRTLRRNFQGYTTDAAGVLIGLGASSISALPQGYVQNDANIEAYCEAVESGAFSGARGLVLSDEDRLRGKIIEDLMCFLEADMGPLGACGISASRARLVQAQEDGLAEVSGNRVRITEKGRPFARAVCTAFDAWYEDSATRHARAV